MGSWKPVGVGPGSGDGKKESQLKLVPKYPSEVRTKRMMDALSKNKFYNTVLVPLKIRLLTPDKYVAFGKY